jgi:hypothetical protein
MRNAACHVPLQSVAGERPTNRIDRQVYDVKSDVQHQRHGRRRAGNVPSVAVDPDGTVSLRGSTNVQILVDGKPSAMLQGDNRGPALQAWRPTISNRSKSSTIPARSSATRRRRADPEPGDEAQPQAGRLRRGQRQRRHGRPLQQRRQRQLQRRPWGFQGGVNVRHDGRNSTAEVTERERSIRPPANSQHSSQSSVGAGLNDMAGVNGTLSYNLNQVDTLTGSANYNSRTNDQRGSDRYINGARRPIPASDYVRSTKRSGDSTNFSWGARYDHKGALPGETLKIDLRVSASDNDSDSAYANDLRHHRHGRHPRRPVQQQQHPHRRLHRRL